MRFNLDKDGLIFEADFIDTELWRESRELVKKGVLNGASVGFSSTKERMDQDILVYERIKLYEVSFSHLAGIRIKRSEGPCQGEKGLATGGYTMLTFQWPFKLKKRQVSALGAPSEWIPFSNNFPPTQATRLATVGRCLRLYSDFLLQTPLEPKDHYLSKLLAKPNRWQSKKNFYESMAFELLLNGNFMAKVDYDSRGQVIALLPFRAGQIYCHPVNGEYSDPVALQRGGYYYKDFKGRVFMPDDIFHLRDSMFNTSDQLNGLSRVYLYELLFQSGYSIQAVQQSLSASGLRPSWMLSGLPEDNPESTKSVRDTIKAFFQSGQSAQPGAVLSLPEGFELKAVNA